MFIPLRSTFYVDFFFNSYRIVFIRIKSVEGVLHFIFPSSLNVILHYFEQLYGNQLLKVVKASLGAGGHLTGSGSSHVGSKALHLAAVSCSRTRSIFPRTAVLTMSTLALLGARMYVMGSQLPVFTRLVCLFTSCHLCLFFVFLGNGRLYYFKNFVVQVR